MIDLHTHSTASDGSLTPGRLAAEARSKGLSAFALTDHDTIDGLAEAKAAAEKLGICFIPGVEIAVKWEPGEFHLLGLGIRKPSAGFLEALARTARMRENRNRAILARMNETLGLNIDYAEILALSGGHSVGRPHFAKLLVQRKIVKNIEQAFNRYFGKDRPFYIPKENLNFQEAVQIIKESGGIAVLAHPLSLYVAWGRLPGLIKSLRDQGLDGVEAWHPSAKVGACKRLDALGREYGLYVTAGSDFHGEARPNRKLGITAGGRKIEDAFLEAIPPLNNFFHFFHE
jgi:predicted metal-dependent phosphoesterase TrpH